MIHAGYCAERQGPHYYMGLPSGRLNSPTWPRNCKRQAAFPLSYHCLRKTINMSVHKTCLCIKLPRRSSSCVPNHMYSFISSPNIFLSIYCILRIVLTIQRQMRPDPYPREVPRKSTVKTEISLKTTNNKIAINTILL